MFLQRRRDVKLVPFFLLLFQSGVLFLSLLFIVIIYMYNLMSIKHLSKHVKMSTISCVYSSQNYLLQNDINTHTVIQTLLMLFTHTNGHVLGCSSGIL